MGEDTTGAAVKLPLVHIRWGDDNAWNDIHQRK